MCVYLCEIVRCLTIYVYMCVCMRNSQVPHYICIYIYVDTHDQQFSGTFVYEKHTKCVVP